MVCGDHLDTRKLALGAGHRRQRECRHTHGLAQHRLQFVHAGQKSLAVLVRYERVLRQETGQHREGIAGPWIVFHRAGAERVEMRVDREILLRQAGVMPHRLQLGYLGQRRPVAAQQVLWNVGQVRFALGRLGSAPAAGSGMFVNQHQAISLSFCTVSTPSTACSADL